MRTVKPPPRFVTGCGLTLVKDGATIYPLTRCCSELALWTAECSKCHRRVAEAYTLAAVMGDRWFRRDLSRILWDAGCRSPEVCIGDLMLRV